MSGVFKGARVGCVAELLPARGRCGDEGGLDIPFSESLTVLPLGCQLYCVFSVKIEQGGWYVIPIALCSRVKSYLVGTLVMVTSPSALPEE